ncbi:MAG: Holliday junction ATP-dependent DNA helicase RuvB [Parcubacteria group bacterium GW2011_GWA2_39_18]|nr:MAG: Holliday junction ATP-dependent DNA helicase RuvB [Parcubacteria group bacterium GW2011_GWA2_39_18]
MENEKVLIRQPADQSQDNNLDRSIDTILRPKKWEHYIGQEKVKAHLKIAIDATKKRSEALEHVLLYGSSGLGKTTLANIIARELGSQFHSTSGAAIEKVGDLAAVLTNLGAGDVLFIDEIHRLNKLIEEILYPAMENRVLDIILGKGPSARTIQLELQPFTLIAATTQAGKLSAPLRSRFGLSAHLEFYNTQEIQKILENSSRLLNINIEPDALEIIAASSRATPRIANRILKRVRDFAEVKGKDLIEANLTKEALDLLEIDKKGLEATDRKILNTIIEKFSGGPAGVQAIAAATNEDENTIEDVFEPYLMQLGFLMRTSRGRVVTDLGYKHLGLENMNKNNQQNIFNV